MSEVLIARPTDAATWIEAKNDWIGASEVASLFTGSDGRHLGFDPPLTLLRVKAGIQKREPRPELEIYSDVEPGLLARWSKLTKGPNDARLNTLRDVYHHEGAPFLRATPDAFATDRLVQLKVARDPVARWDEDGPPLGYLLQVQAEMFCAGVAVCELYALFRREDPMVDRVWAVEALPDVQAEICARVAAFWSMVEEWRAGNFSRLPVLSDDDGAALASLVKGRKPDVLLQASEAVAGLATEWLASKERAAVYSGAGDALGKVEKMLRHRLIGAMGDASILVLPDGRKLRAKAVERDGYQVQPTGWVELSEIKEKSK